MKRMIVKFTVLSILALALVSGLFSMTRSPQESTLQRAYAQSPTCPEPQSVPWLADWISQSPSNPTVEQGDDITLYVTIENKGTEPWNAGEVGLYEMDDLNPNDFDKFTYPDGGGGTNVVMLNQKVSPGGRHTFTFRAAPKASTSPGDYRIDLGLHGPTTWIEATFSGNGVDCGARVWYPIEVIPGPTPVPTPDPSGKPDLLPSFEGVTSSDPHAAGGVVEIKSRVKNSGDANAGASYLGIWVSSTKEGDPIDPGLVKEVAVPSIIAGDRTDYFYESVSIPSGLADGEYYVTFEADYRSQIAESDEDNRQYSTFTIGTTPPGNDCSQFISDVTIPDDTVMQAGQTFNKVWRLKNCGDTTWGSSYRAVRTSGSFGPSSFTIPSTAPGAEVNIGADMTAPTTAGTHEARYKIEGPSGQFGVEFYVRIVVDTTPPGDDCSQFISDVTIPDDTVMQAGQTFNKVWRLKNCGSTTWGSSYRAVRTSGSFGPSSFTIPSTAPGAEVNIGADMTAPTTAGTHEARYKIEGPSGQFGVEFYVRIVVEQPNNSSISGYVRDSNGNGISEVTMNFGVPYSPSTTDANGFYSHDGFTDGTYNLTPSKGGCSFTPSTQNVTLNGASQANVNFTATCSGQSYSISGYVRDSNGNGISGVTVSFGPSASPATTNDNGYYSRGGFANGSYPIVPKKSGYTFSPPSTVAVLQSGSLRGINFVGTAEDPPTPEPTRCSDGDWHYTVDSNLKQAIDVTGTQLDSYISSKRSDSPLIGLGDAWVRVGKEYGIDAIFLMSLAIHETGWGTNNLTKSKNNIYSWDANDSCPQSCAASFSTKEACIEAIVPKIDVYYLTPGGRSHNGATLRGMNVSYASDQNWKNAIVSFMNEASNHIGLCSTPDWRADWDGQYHPNPHDWSAPIIIPLGRQVTVWAKFQNTGNAAWDNIRPDGVSLNVRDIPGSTAARHYFKPDGSSVFACPDWEDWDANWSIDKNHRPVYLAEDRVEAGEVGTFEFSLCANAFLSPSPHYIANFEIAHGTDWFVANDSNVTKAWFPVFVTTPDSRPPQVDAGPSLEVRLGDEFTLDGIDSFDPDGGKLHSYKWSIVNAPAGQESHEGTLVCASSGSYQHWFVPSCVVETNRSPFEQEGEWTLRLMVTDDEGETREDNMTLTIQKGGFLNLPIDYEGANMSFYDANASRDVGGKGSVNSWLDHEYPFYNSMGQYMRRWDGEPFYTSYGGAEAICNKLGLDCYDGHNGVDFTQHNGIGTRIFAAAPGVVKYTEELYGKSVVIYHDQDGGYFTMYSHLAEYKVKPGDRVNYGTEIGTMGDTGTEDIHLHFGVYKGKEWLGATALNVVDPYGWDGEGDDPCTKCQHASTYLWKEPISRSKVLYKRNGRIEPGPSLAATSSISTVAILVSPSKKITATVPIEALPYTTTVEIKDVLASQYITGMHSVGTGFEFQVPTWKSSDNRASSSAAVTRMQFQEPVMLTIDFSSQHNQHLDLNQLTLYRKNEATGTWEDTNAIVFKKPEVLTTTLAQRPEHVVTMTTMTGLFTLQAPLKCPMDSTEPIDDNPPMSEANMVMVEQFLTSDGTPIQRFFDIAGDQDWLSIRARKGVTYTFQTENLTGGANTVINIYDTDQTTVLTADDKLKTVAQSYLEWVAPESATYYIKVEPAASSNYGCETGYEILATTSLSTITLSAEPNPYSFIELDWNPTNQTDISAYRITRAIRGTSVFTPIVTLTETLFLFFDRPEQETTTEYCYQVAALDTSDTAMVTSNIACAELVSFDEETPIVSAIETLTIDGMSSTGNVHTTYPFTATVTPISATLPITYTWQATDQDTVLHTGALSDTVDFTWNVTGTKTITVTASNGYGEPAEATHSISIALVPPDPEHIGQKLYLPLVVR